MAGSAVIGSLRVNLGIDSAEFATGVKRVQSSLGALGGMFKAFAAGAAAALSLGAITRALGATIDKADELGKTAQKIGIPVQELSKLEYAAKLADVSLEQLSTGVGKLSKNMAAIAGGKGGDAGRALAAIGVSATTANGQLRPTADVIKDVAEQFAGMKDGAGKTALAMAIFGKSGAELIPLLNAGKTGLNAMAIEAETLGLVVSTQTAVAAEGFNDNLTRLGAVGRGMTMQLAEGMLPALQNITEMLFQSAKGSYALKYAGALLGAVLKGLVSGIVILGASLKVYWQLLITAAEGTTEFIKGNFDTAIALFQRGGDDAVATAKNTIAMLQDLWSEGEAPGIDVGGTKRDPPSLHVVDLTDKVKALGYAGGVAGGQLSSAFGQVGESAETLGQQIGQTLGSSFQDWIGQALDGTFKLKDALKDLLSEVSKMALNSFLQKLMGGLGGGGGHPLYGGGMGGGFLSGIGKIFGFKDGGEFRVGGSGGVDSQLVQFMASPNERVKITKPGQDRGDGGDRTSITFNISTPDVAGFRRSQGQLAAMVTRTAAMGQRNL